MIKGKGEMTTYWLIGTAPAPKRGEPDGGDCGLKLGTEVKTSITDENLLHPQRARKQAIAHNNLEQVGTSHNERCQYI